MFRLGRGWASAGLVLALGFLVNPGHARAAFVSVGIIIDQTILMPTGDPQFEFDFRASLASQNALSQGDYIVFDNIPDYAGASFTSTYYGNSLFGVSATTDATTHLTDITFTYQPAGVLSNPGMASIPLGDFLVATTDNYDPSNIPPQLLVSFPYMTQTTSTVTGQKNFGTGMTPIPSLATVPEPASLVLVAIGVSAAALARRRRRRRA